MKAVLILILSLCLLACASVRNPEGGPKDTEPPRLLACVPAHNSLNFKGKSIQLLLSEEVAEDNVKIRFLSPVTTCTATAGSKKLKITPDSGFLPNTTYVLSLKGKIKDEREGNRMKDTSIVFSTGPVMDSLVVRATIENMSGKLMNQRLLMLLSNHRKQVFAAQTDSMKPFVLQGLAPDRYRVMVFQDRNENYIYEEEDGPLWTDSLQADSSLFLKGRLLPQKYKPVKTFKLRKGDTCVVESSNLLKAGENFQQMLIASNKEKTLFWLYPVKKELLYHYSDSLGNAYADTLKPADTDSGRSLPMVPTEKNIHISKEGKSLNIKSLWNWKIFRHPAKLEFTYDSVWTGTAIEKLDYGFSFRANKATTGKLKWRMDTLVLFNQTGMKSDSVRITGDDLENTGTISGEVQYDGTAKMVVELIDTKNEQAGILQGKKFSFRVKPGRYKIQMYLDLDGNGMYTGGNKEALRKAEPLYVMPEMAELKPGWDLENIKIEPGF